jgi:hypothetical protein
MIASARHGQRPKMPKFGRQALAHGLEACALTNKHANGTGYKQFVQQFIF